MTLCTLSGRGGLPTGELLSFLTIRMTIFIATTRISRGQGMIALFVFIALACL
jgi:hypothetical protein